MKMDTSGILSQVAFLKQLLNNCGIGLLISPWTPSNSGHTNEHVRSVWYNAPREKRIGWVRHTGADLKQRLYIGALVFLAKDTSTHLKPSIFITKNMHVFMNTFGRRLQDVGTSQTIFFQDADLEKNLKCLWSGRLGQADHLRDWRPSHAGCGGGTSWEAKRIFNESFHMKNVGVWRFIKNQYVFLEDAWKMWTPLTK